MSKKRPFTLLELFICISILALLATTIAFPLKGMLQQHQFNMSVKRVVIQLRELQALALNYQSDMGLKFYEEKGAIMCTGFTDEPKQKFKPFQIENITSLTFDSKKVKMPLEFKIYSNGRIEPQGSLRFRRQNHRYELDLGAPFQIKLKEKYDETEEQSV